MIRFFIFLIIIIILPIGCGGYPKTSQETQKILASILVSPSSTVLKIGETKKFSAVGYDQANSVMNFVATWSISGEAGMIETYSGLFTAISAGSCEVIAASGSIKGKASVSVTGEALTPIVLINITPKLVTLNVGQFAVFAATGFDKDNKIVTFAPIWTILGGVGIIESSGLFTATAPGTGRIIASSGGVQGEAVVIVNESPF